jgi:hypothetical protein
MAAVIVEIEIASDKDLVSRVVRRLASFFHQIGLEPMKLVGQCRLSYLLTREIIHGGQRFPPKVGQIGLRHGRVERLRELDCCIVATD